MTTLRDEIRFIEKMHDTLGATAFRKSLELMEQHEVISHKALAIAKEMFDLPGATLTFSTSTGCGNSGSCGAPTRTMISSCGGSSTTSTNSRC
jgi:hypothetical protein